MCVSTTVLTIADGAQRVIVTDTLADDPPLGEYRVWADGAHIEGAPCSQKVVSTDVTLTASNGKVPVGQSESRVAQHVLHTVDEIRESHLFMDGSIDSCLCRK